jgi:hypothetical protein
VLVRVATRRNLAPDPTTTDGLNQCWAVLPPILVPLTFAFFFLPGSSRWWLLLRIDLAIAIGLAIATTQYAEGLIYHEPSSGPGAGTAWLVMIGIGYMLMVLGTVVAAFAIWWRGAV